MSSTRKLCIFLLSTISFVFLIQSALASGEVAALVLPGSKPHDPSQVYTMNEEGQLNCVTQDQFQKRLPVISPDGKMIAYESPGRDGSSTMVIIVDLGGREVAHILVQPEVPDMTYLTASFYVDQIQWVGSGNRIAVRGWINPSQALYYLFDITSLRSIQVPLASALTQQGLEVASFVDDNGKFASYPAASFSPDGSHFAYITGIPHFGGRNKGEETSNQTDRPALGVDSGTLTLSIYPHKILSPIVWSSDNTLALVTNDFSTDSIEVVTAQVVNKKSPLKNISDVQSIRLVKTVIPTKGKNSNFRLFWRKSHGTNNLLLVQRSALQSKSIHIWELNGGTGPALTVGSVPEGQRGAQALSFKVSVKFLRALRDYGFSPQDVDIWLPEQNEVRKFPRDDEAGIYYDNAE